MALASLLLQKHYICLYTGEDWKSIEIRRGLAGKPYFGDLQYNVSKADDIVVFIGFHHHIGVDIVRRNMYVEDLSSSELVSLFSPLEREALSICTKGTDYNDLYLFNWAFKEAYMKFLGVPDWDNVASIEFLGIQCPVSNESCVTNAVSKVLVSGGEKHGYTESHIIDNNHLLAIYTSSPPDDSNDTQFKRITLEEIVVPLSNREL